MPYLGNEPAVAYTSTTKDSFSGDGSTTAFTMSKSANVNAVRVVVENVIQDPTVAYTCSGTTLTFTSAPPSGTNNVYVVHLGPPAATVAPPTTINNATTFTGGVTLKNETPEDTDGGRESIVTFKGLQSGQEESTLAQIQAAHDGSSDDEKGLISFKTNDGNDSNSPTERWRITSDGHLKAMVDGYGIDFSASEGTNAASSILDDYEEGTWTPVLKATTTDPTVGGYHSNTGGRYTKIGNRVYVNFFMQTTSITSNGSGTLQIGGLPYTNIVLPGASEGSGMFVNYYVNTNLAAGKVLHGYVRNGQTNMLLIVNGNGDDTGAYAAGTPAGDFGLYAMAVYHID